MFLNWFISFIDEFHSFKYMYLSSLLQSRIFSSCFLVYLNKKRTKYDKIFSKMIIDCLKLKNNNPYVLDTV